MFGVDGKATLWMQMEQEATQLLNKAELVAQTIEEKLQTIELVQQTINDRINLVMKPYTQVMGMIARYEGLVNETISLQNQFASLYEDPTTSGNIFRQVQYNQNRLNSSLDRLQRLDDRAKRLGTKINDVNDSIMDLGSANEKAEGNKALQQIGNEAALLNANLQTEQIAGQQEMISLLKEREMKELENKELARARHCQLWNTGEHTLPECE